MVTGTFELFDHTADMGICVRADSLAGLIEPAAAGFYAAIGELKANRSNAEPFQFEAQGKNDAILLRDFLTELLVLFERDHRMLLKIEVAQLGGGKIVVKGRSAPVDPTASIYCREVKAVTYHELELRPVERGFEAKLILDI